MRGGSEYSTALYLFIVLSQREKSNTLLPPRSRKSGKIHDIPHFSAYRNQAVSSACSQSRVSVRHGQFQSAPFPEKPVRPTAERDRVCFAAFYAFRYFDALPAPIRWIVPSFTMSPGTASTVAGLTSGRFLQISALESGVGLFNRRRQKVRSTAHAVGRACR